MLPEAGISLEAVARKMIDRKTRPTELSGNRVRGSNTDSLLRVACLLAAVFWALWKVGLVPAAAESFEQ